MSDSALPFRAFSSCGLCNKSHHDAVRLLPRARGVLDVADLLGFSALFSDDVAWRKLSHFLAIVSLAIDILRCPSLKCTCLPETGVIVTGNSFLHVTPVAAVCVGCSTGCCVIHKRGCPCFISGSLERHGCKSEADPRGLFGASLPC